MEQPNTFSMYTPPKKHDKYFVYSCNHRLNQLLGGGLHAGMITQLYGEAGSGKTQLAMLFTIGAMSRNQMVAWISVQKQLHMGRFVELAYSSMNESEFEEKQNYLQYSKIEDYNLAMEFIENIMAKMPTVGGLLVIDTVYALINAHSQNMDHFGKSKLQAQFVNRLRCLAKISNCAVLLINNAADIIDRKSSIPRKFNSALGPAWELNLDENIEISRKGQLREIVVLNSPKCQSFVPYKFRICKDGFVWVSDEGIQYE